MLHLLYLFSILFTTFATNIKIKKSAKRAEPNNLPVSRFPPKQHHYHPNNNLSNYHNFFY